METAGLGLPTGRKRDREFKAGRGRYDAEDDNETTDYGRSYKAARTDSRDYVSSFSEADEERRRQEADLEQDLNVGARGQIAEPTDDPIGASFGNRTGQSLAAAMSVGARGGAPFGSAARSLPSSRGPMPPPGGMGLRGTGADVDAMMGIFPQNGRSRVVRSSGRDAPAAPQSNIVVTVIVAKNIYETRSKVPDDDAIAPLGTEEDFRIMQGEWCFLTAEQRMANRMTMLQDTDIEVVSCVNGKSRHERLQFVGMMAGKGSNPADPRADDHATVQIAGVMSGINTGLETIPPFVPVHFREDPAAVVDSSGHLVPAVAEQGQPTTKFRPTTYPFTEEITSASVARLQIMVDSVWKDSIRAIQDGTAVNMNVAAPPTLAGDGVRQLDFWRKVRVQIDNYFNQPAWGREDHPLKIFAKWYAVSQAMNLINYNTLPLANSGADDPNDKAWIFSRFFQVIRFGKMVLADQQRNKHMRDYNTILGQKMTTRLPGYLQSVWSTGMLSDAMLPVGGPAWTGGLRLMACHEEAFGRVRQELTTFFQAQMIQAVQEQHYKNRLSFGGISLKLAQPGKPLDLLK